jgi:diacylglycerol O-acyltransferase / wax synthase
MQQLSGLDAGFLAMETPTVQAHVGGVCILDPSDASPLDLERLTSIIGERLHLAPILRQRLVGVPLGLDMPYWMDDPDFDLEYHVRELALPAPGSEAQLTEQVARIHARQLDRRRPLWELYLISGLAGGRLAAYTKMHHAAIDGISGTELLTALLDLSPQGRQFPPAAPFVPEPPPSSLHMLARTARTYTTRPLAVLRLAAGLARRAPALSATYREPLERLLRLGERDGDTIGAVPVGAPATPLNQAITQHRRVAFRAVALEDVKRVKKAHGVTVNDVVMAMSAGALRRWLIDHDALPEQPLLAMVPVSVRAQESGRDSGNKVSSMFAVLPTHLADPVERLRVANQATRIAKAQHAALPPGLVHDVTAFAIPALAGRASRVAGALGLMQRVNPFNLVVSNVPGPNIPVYLGGLKVTEYYPVSTIPDGQALNITVLGYLGVLHFGLVACRELVPDVDALAGHLVAELEDLVKTVFP